MKQVCIGLLLFGIFTNVLYVKKYTCITEWVQQDGKKYKPPNNIKTIHISPINNLESVRFETENYTSYYNYRSFLYIDGKLGVSYVAANQNILDLFKDGILMLWRGNVPLLKASCPNMRLNISKIK